MYELFKLVGAGPTYLIRTKIYIGPNMNQVINIQSYLMCSPFSLTN